MLVEFDSDVIAVTHRYGYSEYGYSRWHLRTGLVEYWSQGHWVSASLSAKAA